MNWIIISKYIGLAVSLYAAYYGYSNSYTFYSFVGTMLSLYFAIEILFSRQMSEYANKLLEEEIKKN